MSLDAHLPFDFCQIQMYFGHDENLEATNGSFLVDVSLGQIWLSFQTS
jgi:hypothetical protein